VVVGAGAYVAAVDTNAAAHWDHVWATRGDDELSWFQATSEPCASLVREVTPLGGRVVVVGAGSSILVDELADDRHVVAVDVSTAAIERLAARVFGHPNVSTLVADVRTLELDEPVDTWHDRAVFHFLIDADDRGAYRMCAARAVRPGGHLVIATFALDGPEQCSGLPVRRYDADDLAREFSDEFDLVGAQSRQHQTPWGAPQSFTHAVLQRRA
jgi:SAM-dependent methyltransferase